MKSIDVFHCAECGKRVVPMAGHQRTREYARGYPLLVPDEFEIPTCVGCGETYMTEELSKKLDPLLRKQFLKIQAAHYRELVDILAREHNVTQKDIVRACQVTPSYLSHVLAGKRQASATLTRLLEAFVACSSEFRRNLADIPWSVPTKPLLAKKPSQGIEQWGNVVDLNDARGKRLHWATPANGAARDNIFEVGAA